MSYSLAGYGRMIADEVRIRAYSEALRRAVKADSVVLDIGTGTGIFALLACRYGARRVYAVEKSPIIEIARELCLANGFCDRVDFIQAMSDQVDLPEKVDLIISDMRDMLPYYRGNLPSLANARQRFLKPGGAMIAAVDRVYVALIAAPEAFAKKLEGWGSNQVGLDLSGAQKWALNSFSKIRADPGQLIVDPQEWAAVDYLRVDNWNATKTLGWDLEKPATGHGLVAWFDTVLCDGVELSNSPCAPEMIYGNVFFPWLAPVLLETGDRVEIFLEARLIGEEYIWRWNTTVFKAGQTDAVKARFRQSTFLGSPAGPASLRKQTHDYVPSLNPEGEVDRFVFSLMDGQRTLDEIAALAMNQFPLQFKSRNAALACVGKLSEKYSR